MVKGLIKIVYFLIVTAILAVTLLLVFSFFPIPGNYQVKVVLSGSMEPEIGMGSIVVIKPASSYAVGDVITFGNDSRREVPVTHRIIDETPAGYTTKGDANKSTDPEPVRDRDIIGKVLFNIPYIGFILDFAKKPQGFLVLVIIPAVIIAISEIMKIIREVGKMYRRRQAGEQN